MIFSLSPLVFHLEDIVRGDVIPFKRLKIKKEKKGLSAVAPRINLFFMLNLCLYDCA